MPNFDSDDEESIGGAFEGGHWVWDEEEECLVYVSDLPQQVVEAVAISTKAPTGTIEFKDNIDVLEQMRFRKRYQRKVPYGGADIITIQDVKDIALYTAPVQILSVALINLLHLSTTERFLRALILYCQYYLQIADTMHARMAELKTKIRTSFSDVVEAEFRSNLADLRLLVAKEYFAMLAGTGDTAAFHHMGPMKKSRSLSDKDARLFETLLRISVQIVWLALGRRSFNQLELEINRLFKSEIFNAVEHNLKTGYLDKMTKEERSVLLGTCLRRDQKLTMRSPLENDVFCHRKTNFRIFGIGVIKYPELTPRLQYMLIAIASPEELLQKYDVTVGILGMERALFDTLLNVIPSAVADNMKGSATSRSRNSVSSQSSRGSNVKETAGGAMPSKSSTKSQIGKKDAGPAQVYPDIYLPLWSETDDIYPENFPDAPDTESEARKCDRKQRQRWQSRLQRLLHPERASLKSAVSKKSGKRIA